jgi:type I restriction enzyme R subunit
VAHCESDVCLSPDAGILWITGVDVPTCSTVYLDKPMKNHTLMQTIARASRRAPRKTVGVVVD